MIKNNYPSRSTLGETNLFDGPTVDLPFTDLLYLFGLFLLPGDAEVLRLRFEEDLEKNESNNPSRFV